MKTLRTRWKSEKTSKKSTEVQKTFKNLEKQKFDKNTALCRKIFQLIKILQKPENSPKN